MPKLKKLLAFGLLALAAMWLVPSTAEAVGVRREGVMAEEYSNWGGVRVCDEKADGNGVYSQYRRDSGSRSDIRNYNGNGTCQKTGTSSNRVDAFNACNDLGWRPDPCTSYVYR